MAAPLPGIPSTPSFRRRLPRNSFNELLYHYAETLFKVAIRVFTLGAAMLQDKPEHAQAIARLIQYSFVGRLLPSLLTSFALIQSPSVLRMVEALQDLRKGIESIALTLPSAVQSEKAALHRLTAPPTSLLPSSDSDGGLSPRGSPFAVARAPPGTLPTLPASPEGPGSGTDDFLLSLDWWHDLLYSAIFLSARMGGIMITYLSEKLRERENSYSMWLNLGVLQAGLAVPDHEQGKREKLLDDIINFTEQGKRVWEALKSQTSNSMRAFTDSKVRGGVWDWVDAVLRWPSCEFLPRFYGLEDRSHSPILCSQCHSGRGSGDSGRGSGRSGRRSGDCGRGLGSSGSDQRYESLRRQRGGDDPTRGGGGISGAVNFVWEISRFPVAARFPHKTQGFPRNWHPWLSPTDPAKPYAPQHFSECPPDLPHKIQGLPRNFPQRNLPPRICLGTKSPPPAPPPPYAALSLLWVSFSSGPCGSEHRFRCFTLCCAFVIFRKEI